jgi:hypothetical protein
MINRMNNNVRTTTNFTKTLCGLDGHPWAAPRSPWVAVVHSSFRVAILCIPGLDSCDPRSIPRPLTTIFAREEESELKAARSSYSKESLDREDMLVAFSVVRFDCLRAP